jgi:hypothetical protein
VSNRRLAQAADRAREPLPSPATIWEMFCGFHRMRECAISLDARG